MIYTENAMIDMIYKESAMINIIYKGKCYQLWLQCKVAQVRRELGVPWLFIHAVMLF